MTKHLTIGTTDVFLQDYEENQGKITVSDSSFGYNSSHYWGSMGGTISEFLLDINPSYFSGKLGPSGYDMDIKKTVTAVRKYIRKESDWKFYYDTDFDLEIRGFLREVEQTCEDANQFVDRMCRIKDRLSLSDCDRDYRTNAEDLLNALSSEPWYFIVDKPKRENAWLEQLLPKIQAKIREEAGL